MFICYIVRALLERGYPTTILPTSDSSSDESKSDSDDDFEGNHIHIDHTTKFYEETALFKACINDSTECASLLLQFGASTNLPSSHDEQSLPIEISASNGNAELTRLLLDCEADISCFEDDDDYTIDDILTGTSKNQLACKTMIINEFIDRQRRSAFDSFINHHIEYPPLIQQIYSTFYPSGDLRVASPAIGWDRANAVRNKYYFDEVLFYVHVYVAKEQAKKTDSDFKNYLATNSDDTSTLMTVISDRLKMYLKP